MGEELDPLPLWPRLPQAPVVSVFGEVNKAIVLWKGQLGTAPRGARARPSWGHKTDGWFVHALLRCRQLEPQTWFPDSGAAL